MKNAEKKVDKRRIDRRKCRKFADPGLKMRRGCGLLCADQISYIVRTAIKIIGHQKLLVLYVYSRKEAAEGIFRPCRTVFQGRGDFATLTRKEDGTLVWHKASFAELEGGLRFADQCAFYSPGDEERVRRFCKEGISGGFGSLRFLQLKIQGKRRWEKQRKREQKILGRMKVLPPLPRDLTEWVRTDIMPAYFFYDYQRGKKEVEGVCSSCGKKVVIRGAKYNAESVCPGCGREMLMKSRGRRGNLSGRDTLQVVQKTGPEEVAVRIVKCSWFYGEQNVPKIYVWENARFFIRLEGDRVKCDRYYDSYQRSVLTGWREGRRRGFTYYQYSFEADICGHLYCRNLPGELKGTPWQYCPVREYYEHDRVPMEMPPFLYAYICHPRLEHLVKVGFWKLVFKLVYRHDCDGLMDETQDRTHRILRVGAEDVPFLRSLDIGSSELEVFQEYCRRNLKERQKLLLWQIENKAWRDVPEILAHMTPHKMMRYLERQYAFLRRCKTENGRTRYSSMQDIVSEYRDYLEMCVKQKYDMKNSFVLYPNDLQEAHDKEARRVKQKADAKLRRAFKAVCMKLKGQLDFEMDGMKIVYPAVPKDLVSEGHALHHCVGGYADRMAKGECAILFLRRCEEEKKHFYTIEVRNREVVQVRGMKNSDPTPEVKKFIWKWENKVLKAPAAGMAA